jgi:hypothetical protein
MAAVVRAEPTNVTTPPAAGRREFAPSAGPPESFTSPLMVPVFGAPLAALVVAAAEGLRESSPALQPPTDTTDTTDTTVRRGSEATDLRCVRRTP